MEITGAQEVHEIRREAGVESRLGRILAPLGALLVLISKAGAFIVKFKVLTVGISMLVSAGSYALLGGWWFGLGLVLLLFVHEMGHVLECRRQGLPVSVPYFIPFLGAAILMKRMPQDAWHEATMALGGPILGTIGACVPWAIGLALGSNFWKAMAFIGFLINLVNLIPVPPLDGGRAVSAIHPVIWGLGVALLLVLMIFTGNLFVLLIFIFAMAELSRRWSRRNHPDTRDYYRVGLIRRLATTAIYLSLIAFLVVAMSYTHVPRKF